MSNEVSMAAKRLRFEEEDDFGKKMLEEVRKLSAAEKKHRHPIAQEVEDLMQKLTEHGEDRLNLKMNLAIQKVLAVAELKLLEVLDKFNS
uniref:Uncharacterized protein n=1 Tax=Ditylenchus dipsaci TaxID=166011 RepID=A0A915CQN6_9BILA